MSGSPSTVSVTPVNCASISGNSFSIPNYQSVSGACYASTLSLNTSYCLSLNTQIFQNYSLSSSSKVTYNASAIITTTDVDYSECTASTLCSDAQYCRIYNANKTRTLMCFERTSSSSAEFHLFDYTASDSNIKNNSCSAVQSFSNLINCDSTSRSCIISPAISNLSTLINVTTYNSVVSPSTSTPVTESTEVSVGTIIIYLLVPFIFTAILVPCILIRLRRFTVKKPRPIITKSQPVEIIHVPRQELEQEMNLLRHTQQEHRNQSRQDLSSRERLSTSNSGLHLFDNAPNEEILNEKRRLMAMRSISSGSLLFPGLRSTEVASSLDNPQPVSSDLSQPEQSNSSTLRRTESSIVNVNEEETINTLSSSVDLSTLRNNSRESVRQSRQYLMARERGQSLAVQPSQWSSRSLTSPTSSSVPTSPSMMRLAMPIESSDRPQMLSRSLRMTNSQEDIEGSQSRLLSDAQRFSHRSTSAMDLTETTAVIYTGKPPEYNDALSDGVNRPGDQNF